MKILWNEIVRSINVPTTHIYDGRLHYIFIKGNEFYSIIDGDNGVKITCTLSDMEIDKDSISAGMVRALKKTKILTIGKKVVVWRSNVRPRIFEHKVYCGPDSAGVIFTKVNQEVD